MSLSDAGSLTLSAALKMQRRRRAEAELRSALFGFADYLLDNFFLPRPYLNVSVHRLPLSSADVSAL